MVKFAFFVLLLGSTALYSFDSALSMSTDTTRFDYAERSTNNTLLDTETNNFGEITGFSFSLDPRYNGFYANTSYAYGNTNYIGGTHTNSTYGSHTTTTQNSIFDTSYGYKFTQFIDENTYIPYHFGLGYRAWLREIKSTSTVSGYDELYEWQYATIGIGFHTRLSSNIDLGFETSYKMAFDAQMYDNWYGNTYHLQNVYGYTLSVPFEYKFNHSWSAFAIYNYEFWNISASNAINGYYEPDSETKNETLSVGFKYYF
ncbi:MAG: hypothetical protein PHW18_10145 [Sulfuricurvum sp.]|uniref:hypothetical protein n=1 Tax=Sulfuricurvum sp. TaxID=2025608 RepID=UPI00260C7484|nr:hypothetical protein [Sulfuricurvum sp.]MDD2829922.1 hypothetical protein [Sulfuricurvum sp.]MDD4949588.1 hypothetical protein [Sulfuricurvum sp.]